MSMMDELFRETVLRIIRMEKNDSFTDISQIATVTSNL